MLHYQVVRTSPGGATLNNKMNNTVHYRHVRHTFALMCAKNHLLIFSSFLDICENVEWLRFFGPPCIFLSLLSDRNYTLVFVFTSFLFPVLSFAVVSHSHPQSVQASQEGPGKRVSPSRSPCHWVLPPSGGIHDTWTPVLSLRT